MSMDPRDTVEKAGTNPNRGMLTSPYILVIGVALLVVLAVLLFGVMGSGHKGKVRPTTPATTSGQSNPAPQ